MLKQFYFAPFTYLESLVVASDSILIGSEYALFEKDRLQEKYLL